MIDRLATRLVFKLGRRLWAEESKLTSSPAPQEFDRFNAAADLIGADRRLLVAQVKETVFNGQRGIASLLAALQLLGERKRMADGANKAVFLRYASPAVAQALWRGKQDAQMINRKERKEHKNVNPRLAVLCDLCVLCVKLP